MLRAQWTSFNENIFYDFLGRPKPKKFSKNRPDVTIRNHQNEKRRDCIVYPPKVISSNSRGLSASKSKVERFFLFRMSTRAASPAPGSFGQASYQSFSELLPLPVVCSSLLGFLSCHSLKWRISKSRPQRPEQCNIRRRDVSLLRISEINDVAQLFLSSTNVGRGSLRRWRLCSYSCETPHFGRVPV